ncbi:hypothetical protein [Deinococcus kurensis]|uniref:hypothetical protein n=1 Tax=Deinococcus kurensis TaxID=2662757 RepID=UPI0012D35B9A|nr:hypothetical protein [Deinococcus kurensis]
MSHAALIVTGPRPLVAYLNGAASDLNLNPTPTTSHALNGLCTFLIPPLGGKPHGAAAQDWGEARAAFRWLLRRQHCYNLHWVEVAYASDMGTAPHVTAHDDDDTENAGHFSDCAVHDAPAYEAGPCTCLPRVFTHDGLPYAARTREDLKAYLTRHNLSGAVLSVPLLEQVSDRQRHEGRTVHTLLRTLDRMGTIFPRPLRPLPHGFRSPYALVLNPESGQEGEYVLLNGGHDTAVLLTGPDAGKTIPLNVGSPQEVILKAATWPDVAQVLA